MEQPEIVDVTYGDWVRVRGLVTADGQLYRFEGYLQIVSGVLKSWFMALFASFRALID